MNLDSFERSDPRCLNCGAESAEDYCPECWAEHLADKDFERERLAEWRAWRSRH